MRRNNLKLAGIPLAVLIALLGFRPVKALAHCDGMDGPVVQAAQKALETGNVNLVLIWVPAKDEPEIRNVFSQTLAVRKLNPEARGLADRYFFETLVRLHRAGEGEPYTGLKPAGRDLGQAIPAADRALEAGSAQALEKLLSESIQVGVREHFEKALAKKEFGADDVAAGRHYVEAYVAFLHCVERIYEAAKGAPPGHPLHAGDAEESMAHAHLE